MGCFYVLREVCKAYDRRYNTLSLSLFSNNFFQFENFSPSIALQRLLLKISLKKSKLKISNVAIKYLRHSWCFYALESFSFALAATHETKSINTKWSVSPCVDKFNTRCSRRVLCKIKIQKVYRPPFLIWENFYLAGKKVLENREKSLKSV